MTKTASSKKEKIDLAKKDKKTKAKKATKEKSFGTEILEKIKEDLSLDKSSLRYFEAVGRRKTAVARVRLYTKKEGLKDTIIVNGKSYKEYFPLDSLQKIVESPFIKMKALDKFVATVKVKGGGICAQAEAIRHGISRAMVKFNLDFKKRLRRAGFITRDSRMVERKKYGLKKARRAPQWQKR